MEDSTRGHGRCGFSASRCSRFLRLTATRVRKQPARKRAALVFLTTLSIICLFSSRIPVFGLESGTYRLLSVATSGKLILISQPSTKTKYILDASNAKITANGKPLEFQELTNYVSIHVKFDLRKSSKAGIEIDGTASDITVPVTLPGDKPNHK